MSRRVHRAPLAVASDGSVFVNMAEYGGPLRPEALLRLAADQRGRVFIGIELGRKEVADVLRHLDDASAESVARLVGRRQHARLRRPPTP